MSVSIVNALRGPFRLEGFVGVQEQIVKGVMRGRDILAVLPPGGGMSLCYELPAYLLPGTCLVVGRLCWRTRERLARAGNRGIRAGVLDDLRGSDEKQRVERALRSGTCDLVYVEPERFGDPGFLNLLQNSHLCFIAVKAAHRISTWGHDFQSGYRSLSHVREALPDTPLAAFTGPATGRVRRDVIDRLGLHSPVTASPSLNRKQRHYAVVPKQNLGAQVLTLLAERHNQPGLVYRATRQRVEDTAAYLVRHGIPALPCHAGLDADMLCRNRDLFEAGEVDVMVATTGMDPGTARPDIRYVLHGELPPSLEAYYRDTAHAGLDGRRADCVLFYSDRDVSRARHAISRTRGEHHWRVAHTKFEQVVAYCTRRECRRRRLLEYFGERFRVRHCKACDVCRGDIGHSPRSTAVLSGHIPATGPGACQSKRTDGKGASARSSTPRVLAMQTP